MVTDQANNTYGLTPIPYEQCTLFWSQDDLPPIAFGPIDLHHFFDTGEVRPAGSEPVSPDRPLMELEIGSGKGTFIVAAAKAEPDKRFLGVEYASAYARQAADRCDRHGLDNVRISDTEAGVLLRNYVPAGMFSRAHIYFPDPWPKKRHNKRRLIQAEFLKTLHRVLAPGADVRIATDHADYFTWMEEHAAAVADWFERGPFESPQTAGEGELVGTNFERKYRVEGRSFQGMTLRRLDRASADAQPTPDA